MNPSERTWSLTPERLARSSGSSPWTKKTYTRFLHACGNSWQAATSGGGASTGCQKLRQPGPSDRASRASAAAPRRLAFLRDIAPRLQGACLPGPALRPSLCPPYSDRPAQPRRSTRAIPPARTRREEGGDFTDSAGCREDDLLDPAARRR